MASTFYNLILYGSLLKAQSVRLVEKTKQKPKLYIFSYFILIITSQYLSPGKSTFDKKT